MTALASDVLRDGVYIRVSAVMGRKDDHFLSPDIQRAAVERARRSAPGPSVVVDEFADIDVSGGSMDRPQLNRALELARAGQLDRLWVYDLSRWARITTEGLAEMERIEAAGCRVMSAAETVDLSTPEGYFSATMMLAIAKMRRDQIGRSWRQVAEHRVESGRFHGSNPPIGYTLVKGSGLVPHPVEGPAMAAAFRRYADGWKLWHVMQAFRAEADRPRVAPEVMKKALGNPVYVGSLRFKGQIFDGAHEPLVDKVLFDAVGRRLLRESRTPSRRLAIAHPLTGLVRCAHCDRPLQLHRELDPRRRDPTPIWRLNCRGKTEGLGCEGPGRPDADRIAVELKRLLAIRVSRLRADPVEQAARAASRTRAKADAGKLRRELEQVKAARGKLAVDLARRLIDDEPFRLADAELVTEQERLVERLGEVETVVFSPTPTRQVALGQALLDRWDDMTVEERHRGFRAVLTYAKIRRAEHYREPEAARLSTMWLSG